MNAKEVSQELLAMSSDDGREKTEYYFKTGVGTYSAHEEFIGVRMPDVRRIAKAFQALSLPQVQKLLRSQIHEERLCALIILVTQMKSAVKKSDSGAVDEITTFYLANKSHVNNWDLVDASAHYILGQYILLNPTKSCVLYELVESDVIWDRRIAMVSQWLMIREGVYAHVLPLAKLLLDDKEDLMHKAVGWMLREYWKRDSQVVEDFLWEHYDRIPRTTLRYTIERMDEQKRKNFLKGRLDTSI